MLAMCKVPRVADHRDDDLVAVAEHVGLKVATLVDLQRQAVADAPSHLPGPL